MEDLYRKIYASPEFHALERKRGVLSWVLSTVMLISYFSFILIIAFVPEVFARPVFDGKIITWGIPAGLFVIAFGFLLTGIYVFRANNEFDQLSRDIIKRIKADHHD